jgi:hypothetical protein
MTTFENISELETTVQFNPKLLTDIIILNNISFKLISNRGLEKKYVSNNNEKLTISFDGGWVYAFLTE